MTFLVLTIKPVFSKGIFCLLNRNYFHYRYKYAMALT